VTILIFCFLAGLGALYVIRHPINTLGIIALILFGVMIVGGTAIILIGFASLNLP
jgi:hypothetical protein